MAKRAAEEGGGAFLLRLPLLPLLQIEICYNSHRILKQQPGYFLNTRNLPKKKLETIIRMLTITLDRNPSIPRIS